MTAATLAALGCSRKGKDAMTQAPASQQRLPVVFLGHGAPPLLEDEVWKAELKRWADAMPRPSSILMISAHWEDRPATLGATTTVPLVYDYYGFPRHFYEIKYPSPGAPKVAERVRALLREREIPFAEAPTRGLDHGVFIPAMVMYPSADIPILQVSMPGLEPSELAKFGRALAPLADEGVLVVGSGFLTHNMRSLGQPTPAWAHEFDTWSKEVLTKRDLDALVDFRARAPAASLAHPRHEHFAPVIVAAAAAEARPGPPTFPIEGFWNGWSFTKRSVQFG